MPADSDAPAALDEVLGIVASDVRLDILEAAWESAPAPATFSALHSRVGLRDSGTFNYHLDQLVPRFLRKGEDGYALTYAGRQAIGAAVSGRFTDADAVAVGPVAAGDCFRCDGDAEARYADGAITVDCADCGEILAEMPVPPVTVAAVDPPELPAVFSRHLLTRTQRLDRGFCTLCHGRVDASLTGDSDADAATYRSLLDVRFECRQCGVRSSLNVGAVLMDHPAIISLLHDVGIDLRETYVWEVPSLLDPEAAVTSEEPLRLDLTVSIAGEAVRVTVDETASVLETTRL